MKHKKARMLISILLVIICALISLQGCCFLSRWRTPTEEEGISFGFQYENRQGSLITAIKSDKKIFDIDDVTLDFYYGGRADFYARCNSVALYFISGRDNWYTEGLFEDYKNIDGCFFIKEMTINEYESGPFDIEQRWGPKQEKEEYNLYFHFVDTWTIPKEMFEEQTGMVGFFIAHIFLNEEDNGKYKLVVSGPASGRGLYYSKTEDGYVELSTRR